MIDKDGSFRESQFVDRSAQLKATLKKKAMMNVANLMKKNKDDKSKLENNNLKSGKNRSILSDEKILLWEDYQDENEDFLYVD